MQAAAISLAHAQSHIESRANREVYTEPADVNAWLPFRSAQSVIPLSLSLK